MLLVPVRGQLGGSDEAGLGLVLAFGAEALNHDSDDGRPENGPHDHLFYRHDITVTDLRYSHMNVM
jgi:hypothetical protein